MPDQWVSDNESQWVDVDIDQWGLAAVISAVARFITKKATFYFSAVKNTFHFKSKENNYYDTTKENK